MTTILSEKTRIESLTRGSTGQFVYMLQGLHPAFEDVQNYQGKCDEFLHLKLVSSSLQPLH